MYAHVCMHVYTQLFVGGSQGSKENNAAFFTARICWFGFFLYLFFSLYRLYMGIANGMSIARVWACHYSK